MSQSTAPGAETTFRFWQPASARTLQSGLPLAAPPPAPLPLTEKYRPAYLADLVGQGAAVNFLNSYLQAPYPVAFLFEGPTGTGKTSAALALGNELGVNPDWSLHRISSGAMDAEGVESILKCLRFAAPNGGWRLVVVDEADTMSPKAKTLWLSILEDLPVRTVVVFTTNHPEKLDTRFADRCERVRFASDPALLMQDAKALVDRVWKGEGLEGEPVRVGDLPSLVENGAISFRRVVQAVNSCRHGYRPTPAPARPATARAPRPTKAAAAAPTDALALKRREAALKAVATRRARQLAGSVSTTRLVSCEPTG
jgi:hypothetical protein